MRMRKPNRPRDQAARKNGIGLTLLIAVIGFAGALLLLYPSIASWFSQYQESQTIRSYSERVRDLDAGERTASLEAAARYNAGLVDGSSVVAAGERKPLAGQGLDRHAEYSQLLNADEHGLIGRIKIPVISADLPIFHGTSDATLERGIGHLEGSALPIGGESTHAVLTGHRGLATAELFTRLDQVRTGDRFTIEVFGQASTYRVIDTRVVEPNQTETLYPERGRDLVTLVTCTPLGINSHRILVTGERVLPTPVKDVDAVGASPDIPGFPWWAVVLVAVILLLIGYVWRTGRRRNGRQQRASVGRTGRRQRASVDGVSGEAASR